MKKYIALISAAIICVCILLFMPGCSEEKIDIAFVTSLDTGDIGSPAANCLDAVKSYSDDSGFSYKSYFGECDTQIESAVSNGAKAVVVFGADDKNAVYSCAGKYPDTKFICVDFGNDFLVRPNIICVNTEQIQNAVYAGYAAVKEGNLTIGIQGEETAETSNYIRGFVEGAQIAAVEIGVKKNPVQIYFNVSGTDMLSERMSSWYANGCDVIFCSDETYKTAMESVTDTNACSLFTFGADRTKESEQIAASVYSDYTSVVYSILSSAFEESFCGGIMISAEASDGASGFTYDSSAFEVFSETDLNALTKTISESDLSDDTVYRTPSDKGYSKIVLTEAGIISKSE